MRRSKNRTSVLTRIYDFPDFILSRDFREKKLNFPGNPENSRIHRNGKMSHDFVRKIYRKRKKGFHLQLVSNFSIFVSNGR